MNVGTTTPELRPLRKQPPERLLVTAREAARMLSISERTLWGSTIPKVRIGQRGVRYDVQDLFAWIAIQKERVDIEKV